MHRKRKSKGKTKPPDLSAAHTIPPRTSVIRFSENGEVSRIRVSDGRIVPETPESGFSSTYMGYPTLPSRSDGGIDVELATSRIAFIRFMYSEAESYLEQLHQEVYPRMRAVLTAINRNPQLLMQFDQIVLRHPRFMLRWEDFQRPIPILDELRKGIEVWLDGRDLWNDWFIGYVLDLLQDRYHGHLIGVPSLEECYHQVVTYHDGQYFQLNDGKHLSTRYWDKLEIDLGQFMVSTPSHYSFDDIKKAILNEVEALIDGYEAEHQTLRERRIKEVGFKKRNMDHYRRLVRRLWLREPYASIASQEAIRLSASIPEAEAPDSDAIEGGCKKAAAYLSINLPKERIRY